MTKHKKRTYLLQIAAEIIFLSLLTVILLKGRYQLWFTVFTIGAVISFFLSRFYCGWACPMNTVFRPVNWLYSKFHIKRVKINWVKIYCVKTSSFNTITIIRYIILAFFAGTMIITKRTGIEIPLLPVIILLSVILTLIFDESLWHNLLCPFGTILSLTARHAKKSIKINENMCVSCGRCQKVCPAGSIDTLDTNKRQIRTADCLTCYSCLIECPKDAIAYF